MRVFSSWSSVRVWEAQLEGALHRRHSLRTHGILIGCLTLMIIWLVSYSLMRAGVDALAWRYLVSLGAGYLAYLLLLRWWARHLLRRVIEKDQVADGLDVPLEVAPQPRGTWPADVPQAAIRSGGGGNFGGGGASGDFASSEASDAGLTELAGKAFGATLSAEEGAVVVVPVLAIFLAGLALLLGAGAMLMLFFGVDVLLAVAIEVAFAYTGARLAARVAREGWWMAAARLTWKPLLGAMLCAALLGALIDHFVPHANSLPEAVRALSPR